MEKFYETKQYYTSDTLKEIRLYTLDKHSEGARVIGSLSYRSGNASDCDLFETIVRDNKDDLIKLFKNGIQGIVKDLMKDKNQYFLEVKLGLNPYFNSISYGTCSNNVYNVEDGYFDLMKALHTRHLITDAENETISLVRRTYPKKQLEYELVKQIMRKHTILRWNENEILKGYKILESPEGKYKYTIEEAVCDKSQINVEGIFISNDNVYSDCSNFFVLEYGNNEYNTHVLNLSDDALYDASNYRKENLKQSMYTLTYSELQPNLFKALKRMLSYGKSFKKYNLLNTVYPLINSQWGQLYQMTSQLKTIMKILKEHGKKPLQLKPIYNQLDKIRFKLQELIFINTDFTKIFNLIDRVMSYNERVTTSDLYNDLSEITNNLLTYINQQTYNIMRNKGLYPLPPSLTPNEKPF